MKTIYISSDHGGFELKPQIIDFLVECDDEIEIADLGPFELDPEDDYPDYAFPLAEQVAKTEGSIGILICRSGNGMAIAANKVKGIRAALCFSRQHAIKARQDDHANILVLDSDYEEGDDPTEIAREFINTQPELGGRHSRRVQKIVDYEK